MLIDRRRVFAIAFTGVVAAGGLALRAAPAAACGMKVHVPRRSPEVLLVRALDNFEAGKTGIAAIYARALLGHKRASAHARAQALTVVGWVKAANHDDQGALEALRQARDLDKRGDVLNAVLDRASDPEVTARVRRALQA
jgi:hypothetical protein